MKSTVSRTGWFFARWLWLLVAIAVLATAGYLFTSLNRLQDSAALSARVAELRSFQEEMVGAALLATVAGASSDGASQLAALRANTSTHIESLRSDLSAATGAEITDSRLRSIEDGFDAMITPPEGILDGGTISPEVAFRYAATSAVLNGTIDDILNDLGRRGALAVDEVRTAALLGVALLLFGGMAGAAGFGWSTARASRFANDVRRSQLMDAQKSEFVAVASHELRTPLTGIHGFASLLADAEGLSGEHREWARHVYAESGRLTAIVDDLLNLSRIESGSFTVEAERIPLLPLLDDVAAKFASTSDAHTVRLSQRARSVAADTHVLADESKFREVMSNLVDNAIKYSPRGGDVEIAWEVVGEAVRVDISDHGIGIAETDLGRVFDRFERIEHPETRTVRSTGLGLYLVKQMVTRMGGEISVRSEVGRGSTFSFTLPLAEAHEQEAAA